MKHLPRWLAGALGSLTLSCLTLGCSTLPPAPTLEAQANPRSSASVRSACEPGPGYYNSVPGLVPGFVDTQATYWTYGYALSAENAHKDLRFNGQFPYARYASLIAYDENGDTVAQRFDQDLEPDPGSQNPFRAGVPRDTPNRSYTAWLVPEGSARASEPNVLVIPARVKTVVVLYRVYLPDTGRDRAGGVALPTLTPFVGDQLSSCPAFRYPLPSNTPAQVNEAVLLGSNTLESYRVLGSEYQPNGDNPYLAMLLPQTQNSVSVLRYRVPSTPRTLSGGGALSGLEQVRYWSVCLGNFGTTGVSSCLSDEEVQLEPDGSFALAVGPQQVAGPAHSRGLNYLVHPLTNERPVLIFRQIIPAPSYAYPFSEVPPLDLSSATPEQAQAFRAFNFLGDYAPRGVVCSLETFTKGTCG